jgi:hypothetical protein
MVKLKTRLTPTRWQQKQNALTKPKQHWQKQSRRRNNHG